MHLMLPLPTMWQRLNVSGSITTLLPYSISRLGCFHLIEPGSKISPKSNWIFGIFLPSLFYNTNGIKPLQVTLINLVLIQRIQTALKLHVWPKIGPFNQKYNLLWAIFVAVLKGLTTVRHPALSASKRLVLGSLPRARPPYKQIMINVWAKLWDKILQEEGASFPLLQLLTRSERTY